MEISAQNLPVRVQAQQMEVAEGTGELTGAGVAPTRVGAALRRFQ